MHNRQCAQRSSQEREATVAGLVDAETRRTACRLPSCLEQADSAAIHDLDAFTIQRFILGSDIGRVHRPDLGEALQDPQSC